MQRPEGREPSGAQPRVARAVLAGGVRSHAGQPAAWGKLGLGALGGRLTTPSAQRLRRAAFHVSLGPARGSCGRFPNSQDGAFRLRPGKADPACPGYPPLPRLEGGRAFVPSSQHPWAELCSPYQRGEPWLTRPKATQGGPKGSTGRREQPDCRQGVCSTPRDWVVRYPLSSGSVSIYVDRGLFQHLLHGPLPRAL